MTCLRVPSRFSPWLAMVLALGCGVARAQFTGMPSGNGADPGAVSPDGVSGRHAGAWHGHRGAPRARGGDGALNGATGQAAPPGRSVGGGAGSRLGGSIGAPGNGMAGAPGDGRVGAPGDGRVGAPGDGRVGAPGTGATTGDWGNR
ncbi:hypothetical protein ACI2S3_06835 [Ralstonia nicotianae]|uniref:hypothetical protein n=3 Tax=Ralstonia pseudosolanacearum TaxID=1310165 RepID=UPI0005C3D5F3|nr:hypothetical protein [Ralstonia pseudosolanacearum]AKZ27462.1 hypothetical protein ACH51_14730 [Ralstonia solanacearum]AST28939.1 hypothetical protein CDC45_03110 [Ralstonia pseudosolanacearum]OAK92909.1 hypothetical protein AB851_03115 [Ralstonia pseudosolanacearum]QOK86101.1 hypothetical protein HF907_05300 [Ralstonia pseudosolanacearum]